MSTRAGTGSSAALEFQAVILAGGTDPALLSLTSPARPKALLPIANTPLLLYQLQMLKSANITSVIIVTTASAVSGIRELATAFTTTAVMDIAVEICDEEDEEDSTAGTADALRQIKDRITANDCIVLSCDLVAHEGMLDRILDRHRCHQGALTVQLIQQVESKDPKKKRSVENLVMLDDASDTVCHALHDNRSSDFSWIF